MTTSWLKCPNCMQQVSNPAAQQVTRRLTTATAPIVLDPVNATVPLDYGRCVYEAQKFVNISEGIDKPEGVAAQCFTGKYSKGNR